MQATLSVENPALEDSVKEKVKNKMTLIMVLSFPMSLKTVFVALIGTTVLLSVVVPSITLLLKKQLITK